MNKTPSKASLGHPKFNNQDIEKKLTEQSVLERYDIDLISLSNEPVHNNHLNNASRKYTPSGSPDNGIVSKLLVNEFEYLQLEFRRQKQDMASTVNELKQKASELQQESIKYQ